MLRQRLFDFLGHRAVAVFFRRIEEDGIENVPPEGPVIFASNHTNSLVDPLVLGYHLRRPVALTAKASLADNPLLRFILWLADAVCFHRMDEAEDRSRAAAANRRAIEECNRRLKRGEALCIFPEGRSHSEPGLMPFKAGAARIALGCDVPCRIVPTGLVYERKERFRSAALVCFGTPIDVARSGWTAAELTAEIERRVAEITLSFEQRREAVLLEWAARVVATAGEAPLVLGREEPLAKHLARVQRLRQGYRNLSEKAPEEVVALARRVDAYRRELRRLGVEPAEVYLPIHAGRAAFFVIREVELLVIGGPLALLGLVNHVLPYLLVRTLARRLSRERDQWASNAVYPGLVVFPLFYALQVTTAWMMLPALAAAAYTLLLPVSGVYLLLWRDRVGSAWRRAKTFVRWLLHGEVQQRLAEEGRRIIGGIEALAERARA